MKLKIALLCIAGLLAFGCGKEKESHDHNSSGHAPDQHSNVNLFDMGQSSGTPGQIPPHPDTAKMEKPKRTIIVPNSVKGKWKNVKLLVKEKKIGGYNEAKFYKTGDEFTLPDSNINVKVGEFLPHMSIGADTFTSLSNEPVNPAVHLLITEDNKELFNGWAYSKFPDMYNFNHDRFSVTLVDFTPAD